MAMAGLYRRILPSPPAIDFASAEGKTGTGHFSPIGGYHVGRDMALILDVARFKYPPHWVPLTLLWEAMNTLDEASGHRRGFMLISRLNRSPALLYTLSCKHESWVSIASYLMEDVPVLLSSEDVEDIKDVLSIVFNSLPSKFDEFVKWIAEVRRQEDSGQSLSQEEKGRLAVKEEVLKQVQEIGLYEHVTNFLTSGKSCCQGVASLNNEESLYSIAANICCQGAGFMEGNCRSSDTFCCRETCVKCIKANGDKPITVVSGTVVNGNDEKQVDILVPSSPTKLSFRGSGPSNYRVVHPASNDVLTALLLALPPETWSGIKNETLLQDIQSLVSTEKLPTLLQEEILHLRGQLVVLKRCKDNKVKSQANGAFWRLKSFTNKERLVPQRTKCSLSRNAVNWDHHAPTYSGNMTLLGKQGIHGGGFVKKFVKPSWVCGGIRHLTTCPKSILYNLPTCLGHPS